MSKQKVYLAGPITGLTYNECSDWRETAINRLAEYNIVGLSPTRYKEYLRRENTLDAMGYEGFVLSSAKGILTRDYWDCTRSDVVLVNLVGAKQISIGTCMEAAFCHSKQIPIVMAIEEGNLHWHAMLKEAAGFILPTLEDAIDITIALLAEGSEIEVGDVENGVLNKGATYQGARKAG